MSAPLTIENHGGVHILRDDLLPGGTKSVFLTGLIDRTKDFVVYASPVYGGMQIALAHCCKAIGKQAVIFCAKRGNVHPNTVRAKEAGAIVYQVPYGYLSNCQSKAREYAEANNGQVMAFGANYPAAIDAIANRMRQAVAMIGTEPAEIFCAVGSGTLLQGIIQGTTKAKITGIQVGAQVSFTPPKRVRIIKYHKPFEQETKHAAPFPSCANYDLKAWEYCQRYKGTGLTLFWNVM